MLQDDDPRQGTLGTARHRHDPVQRCEAAVAPGSPTWGPRNTGELLRATRRPCGASCHADPGHGRGHQTSDAYSVTAFEIPRWQRRAARASCRFAWPRVGPWRSARTPCRRWRISPARRQRIAVAVGGRRRGRSDSSRPSDLPRRADVPSTVSRQDLHAAAHRSSDLDDVELRVADGGSAVVVVTVPCDDAGRILLDDLARPSNRRAHISDSGSDAAAGSSCSARSAATPVRRLGAELSPATSARARPGTRRDRMSGPPRGGTWGRR